MGVRAVTGGFPDAWTSRPCTSRGDWTSMIAPRAQPLTLKNLGSRGPPGQDLLVRARWLLGHPFFSRARLDIGSRGELSPGGRRERAISPPAALREINLPPRGSAAHPGPVCDRREASENCPYSSHSGGNRDREAWRHSSSSGGREFLPQRVPRGRRSMDRTSDGDELPRAGGGSTPRVTEDRHP
jgi:hypothetical protein